MLHQDYQAFVVTVLRKINLYDIFITGIINNNLVMNLNIELIHFVQVSNEVNVHKHTDQLDPMIRVL